MSFLLPPCPRIRYILISLKWRETVRIPSRTVLLKHMLWNATVLYKNTPLGTMLGQSYPVHTLFSKIHFNITLLSTSRYSMCSLSFRFLTDISKILHLFVAYCLYSPLRPSWYHNCNNIWWSVSDMKCLMHTWKYSAFRHPGWMLLR
jgi:hypothetical protein